MKFGVYVIKDTKVGFMRPFVQPNDAVAVREFTNIVNDGSSLISVNYKDMELYKLGTFDDNTGIIESKVEYLVKAVDVFSVKE